MRIIHRQDAKNNGLWTLGFRNSTAVAHPKPKAQCLRPCLASRRFICFSCRAESPALYLNRFKGILLFYSPEHIPIVEDAPQETWIDVTWLVKHINLKNKHNLHMRPAQRIVEVATRYKAEVHALKDQMDCNCKSILDMIEFAAHMVRATAEDDHSFVFRAQGKDAQQALDALGELVDDRFGLE